MMDHVAFLNSRGAIVSPPPNQATGYAANLHIEPYVEPVMIPVVSVDSAALYGDHPENLATLTYSSGAALTFFCDSVAGGSDASGDGSFDHPWRSLNTASRFLSCASCVLSAAAPYIQLKIRGTVDYVSSSWQPWGALRSEKLILAGWGEKCGLGTATFAAGYFFGLGVKPHYSAVVACSGCTVVSNSAVKSLAVDCEFVSGAQVSCAYNCSGGGLSVAASVFYGGSYAVASNGETRYAYGMAITAPGRRYGHTLFVSNAAVGVSVTAVASGGGNVWATAIYAGGSCNYLGNCTVVASAVADPVASYTQAFAQVLSGGNGTLIVSGGTWRAFASASASGTSDRASAAATASGFSNFYTVAGVSTTLVASAGANFTGQNGSAREWEGVYDMGDSCWVERVREYAGGVVTSSWTSSGGNCGAFRQ